MCESGCMEDMSVYVCACVCVCVQVVSLWVCIHVRMYVCRHGHRIIRRPKPRFWACFFFNCHTTVDVRLQCRGGGTEVNERGCRDGLCFCKECIHTRARTHAQYTHINTHTHIQLLSAYKHMQLTSIHVHIHQHLSHIHMHSRVRISQPSPTVVSVGMSTP